jgi:hypothetical protein
MRIISSFIISLFILTTSFAQGVPQLLNYQGVARGIDNKPVVSQPVSITFSLIQNSVEIWKENTSITTSPLGIFTHAIGSKTAFPATIDWAKPTNLKVEIDSKSIEQQLLSVPYALVAGRALNGSTSTEQKLSLSGNDLKLDPNGGTVNLAPFKDNTDAQSLTLDASGNDYKIAISGGSSNVSIPKNGVSTDGDSDPNNEIQIITLPTNSNVLTLSRNGGTADFSKYIQSLSFDTTSRLLSISGVTSSVLIPKGSGGSSGDNWGTQAATTDNTTLAGNGTANSPLSIKNGGVTADKLNSMNATTGQVLKWDGTKWKPDIDSVGRGGTGGDNWGTQTAVTDNVTLTGNGTSSTGSALSIKDRGVNSSKLALSAVDSINISRMGANSGQVLKWNGTAWAPAIDLTGSGGLTLPYSGSTIVDLTAFVVNSSGSNAIAGISSASSKVAGVFGQYKGAGANGGYGVYGETTTGLTFGVLGSTYSTNPEATGTMGAYFAPALTNWGKIGMKDYAGFFNGDVRIQAGKLNIYDPTKGIKLIQNNVDTVLQIDAFNGDGQFISRNRRGNTMFYVTSFGNAGDAGFLTIKSSVGSPNFGNELITMSKRPDDTSHSSGYLSINSTYTGPKLKLYVDAGGKGRIEADKISIGTPNIGVYSLKVLQNTQTLNLATPQGGINLSRADDITKNWEWWVHPNGDLNLSYNGAFRGYFFSATGAYTSSDKRFKTNINSLKNILPLALQLNPVTYDFIGQKTDNDKPTVGFVAQEVKDLFPNLVREVDGGNGNQYFGINYPAFSVIAIKAIQEQQKQIEGLEKRLDSLSTNKITYERGTAILKEGEAFIPFSEHFELVVNPTTMTVLLTPQYWDTFGLAVVEKTPKGIRVKELKGGKGNFAFDWEVKGVLKGYENFQVIQNKN